MTLPTGVVTFLFTDIEGSTRLWEDDPDAMSGALAWHDRLLREAIATAGGQVFKTIGDAFCAVFETPAAALDAALAAQRGLQAPDAPLPIRVRMALHTGAAEQRDNDYYGRPLNRIARLLATGHGGQVLVTEALERTLAGALPHNVSLHDLGLHSLKDLQRPEHVWQVRVPDLPRDFPPLASLQLSQHNLPVQLTSFIGREPEMEALRTLLQSARLLTVTGAGGCGKTRLALQVAADRIDAFPDGVWLAELAPIQDPALVVPTVAAALRVPEERGKPLRQSLLEFAGARRFLLILDNCEHLLNPVAELVDSLLRVGRELRVLATSREILGLTGETAYRVPSLALPDPTEPLTTEGMAHFDGIRLFLERAASASPTFAPTAANAAALVQICRRLDGIPLALELAAARVRALPVEQLALRLDDRFRLLTAGNRAALPRQQTLRALVDWSYNLLNEPEKALLRRLSVFAGGWSLEAAEAVCADPEAGVEAWETVDLVTSLVDKSLVTFDEPARYRMLETVRQYARECLDEEGATPVRARHRAFFLALAEEAFPHLIGGEQRQWLDRLQAEHDNLRAALDGCLQARDADGAYRFCLALERFWRTHGHWSEGRRYTEALLEQDGGALTPTRRASALHALAILATTQGDLSAGEGYLRDALEIFREQDDRQNLPGVLGHLGVLAVNRLDYDQGRAYLEESLALQRAAGNAEGVGSGLLNLGEIARRQGDLERARTLFEEALPVWEALQHWHPITIIHNNLARIACVQGRYEDAWSLARRSLEMRQGLQDHQGIVLSLEAMAAIASAQGRPAVAAGFLSASETLCASGGLTLGAFEQEEHARLRESARSSLGDPAFAESAQRGVGVTWERAAAFAQEMAESDR